LPQSKAIILRRFILALLRTNPAENAVSYQLKSLLLTKEKWEDKN